MYEPDKSLKSSLLVSDKVVSSCLSFKCN